MGDAVIKKTDIKIVALRFEIPCPLLIPALTLRVGKCFNHVKYSHFLTLSDGSSKDQGSTSIFGAYVNDSVTFVLTST